MRHLLLRFILGLALWGFGNSVFAADDPGSWLTRGLEARNNEDYPDAFQCFEMAAQSGDAEAEYYLGYSYLAGQGISQNDLEGVKWFKKSADQGNAQGEYILGTCYENGRGVIRDTEKAKENYQKAAQQGFAGAVSALNRLDSAATPVSGPAAEAPKVGVLTDNYENVEPANNVSASPNSGQTAVSANATIER